MNQTEPTTETDGIELTYDEATDIDDVPPSTYREAADRLAALKDRGVTVEWTCGECGGAAITTVLPEEQDKPDHLKVSVCEPCIASFLREAEWFDAAKWA